MAKFNSIIYKLLKYKILNIKSISVSKLSHLCTYLPLNSTTIPNINVSTHDKCVTEKGLVLQSPALCAQSRPNIALFNKWYHCRRRRLIDELKHASVSFKDEPFYDSIQYVSLSLSRALHPIHAAMTQETSEGAKARAWCGRGKHGLIWFEFVLVGSSTRPKDCRSCRSSYEGKIAAGNAEPAVTQTRPNVDVHVLPSLQPPAFPHSSLQKSQSRVYPAMQLVSFSKPQRRDSPRDPRLRLQRGWQVLKN